MPAKSRTNRRVASLRAWESGARKIAEGWMVAAASGARGEGNRRPRLLVTRKEGPKIACAAVAPRQISAFGLTTAISASSQGRQAAISVELGFWWIRFLPRGSHLKCLTTLV